MSESTQIAIREKIAAPIEAFSVSIPANAKFEDLDATVGKLCTGLKRVEIAGAHLYISIGRVLREIRNRGRRENRTREGTSRRSMGFRAYVDDVVQKKYGLGRDRAYKMIRVVEAFDNLPTNELLGISLNNLNRVAGMVLKAGDKSPEPVRKLLRDSRLMADDEFKAKHMDTANQNTGRGIIRIVTTPAIKRRVDKWLGEDPVSKIQAAMEVVP